MLPDRKAIFEGIKTFVVLPDLSRMPEDFLSHFFLEGYEVYYILDDPHLDLYARTRVLLTLFPQTMLFFNIERKAEMPWPELIRRIKEEQGARARIGVLYGSQTDAQTRRELQRTYLYDIGIDCGCIPLEYRKPENLARLTSVLAANQAKGRRKFLRAVCDSTCTVSLVHSGIRHEGKIRDISISHFSCVFAEGGPKLELKEKLQRVQLRLSGMVCAVEAIVRAKREVSGELLYIFAFCEARSFEGLSPEIRTKINDFIHTHFRKRVGDMVRAGVAEVWAHPESVA
ncbi:MAG TPA: hypothetical protein VL354_10105 [Spirochaetia bacterium]|nr:hypothetical protein [Spirochaetia bacterium]